MKSIPNRPITVNRAMILLYCYLGLTVILAIYSDLRPIVTDINNKYYIFRVNGPLYQGFPFIFIFFEWLLIFFIGRGFGWARILWVIFAISGFVGAAYTFYRLQDPQVAGTLISHQPPVTEGELHGGPVTVGFKIIEYILIFAAMVFLFMPDSQKWFKAVKTSK